MSKGTRTAPIGAPLSQERWASSRAFTRSLKANLVALRCSVLESPEDREAIWSLQLASATPDDLNAIAKQCRVKADYLREVCLNPESDLDALRPRLRKLLADRMNDCAPGVTTEIGSRINEALEYCQTTRGMVLITGNARTGKTFAAQSWAQAHPGRCRYVQVPSVADDLAWFVAIARALGITIESNAKAKNLRPRIEAALQSGDLMLILDDSQFCWPGHNYRLARPARICWLMTALVNFRVPVALIGTEQFLTAQFEYTKKTGWAAAQFIGRVERFIELPDRLTLPDLKRVARFWLPAGAPDVVEALAHYANVSPKHLAAIEHAVKHARYIASQAGRTDPDRADVQAAIKEAIAARDSGIGALMRRTGYTQRSVSAPAATGPRPSRPGFAEPDP